MNNTSIKLDEQSIYDCVHSIEQYLDSKETKTVNIIAHTKYDNIVITCDISHYSIKIKNTSLGVDISFYYCPGALTPREFCYPRFSSVNKVVISYALVQSYMIEFFSYYLTQHCNMSHSFNKKNDMYELDYIGVIKQLNLVNFENELLIFKTLNDVMSKN